MAKPNTPSFRDLTGQTFTHLAVMERGPTDRGRNQQWVCLCVCGNTKLVRGFTLVNGSTKSCGCLSRKMAKENWATHNRSKDPVYKVWRAMWDRCTNPNNANYSRYKDRRPPEAWRSFEVFIKDLGERPSSEYSLERVDNNKPYGPENCKWATRLEQNNNSSHNRIITYNGISKTVAQWSRHIGVDIHTLRARLDIFRWPIGEALGFETHINRNTKKR